MKIIFLIFLLSSFSSRILKNNQKMVKSFLRNYNIIQNYRHMYDVQKPQKKNQNKLKIYTEYEKQMIPKILPGVILLTDFKIQKGRKLKQKNLSNFERDVLTERDKYFNKQSQLQDEIQHEQKKFLDFLSQRKSNWREDLTHKKAMRMLDAYLRYENPKQKWDLTNKLKLLYEKLKN